MKSNRLSEVKKLCAEEMFDELLKIALEEEMTPEEAEKRFKELMGKKPEKEPVRPSEIIKEKIERPKEIEEIEERNIYNRWLREMREKGLLDKMIEEGTKNPSRSPYAVFQRLKEQGKFSAPPREEKVEPITTHVIEEEPVSGELPFEGEEIRPTTKKYTPGAILAKKCSVCGFLNSPVYLEECKHCKRLYEWMNQLINEKNYTLQEAIMEVYKPFKNIPPGAKVPFFDRLTSKTRNFISPDVLKYIYRTNGETELNPDDIVEFPETSPYLRVQNQLDTVFNIERDPKTKMPVYDENGNPIPLEREMRKYISLDELAKRLLMSKEAVIEGIAQYNAEHGLIPARYYIPGAGVEPEERQKDPEKNIPRKGTGIGPVRDFTTYPSRDMLQRMPDAKPTYYQIYEWEKVKPAFEARLAELPSVFKQLGIIKINNKIKRFSDDIENLRVRIRVIKKAINNYRKFKNYRTQVAKALARLEELRKNNEITPELTKLNNVVGDLLDERNKKMEELDKKRHNAISALKSAIEKKKKTEEYREKFEKQIAKKYPKPLTIQDLMKLQQGINMDKLQEEFVEKETQKKSSIKKRIGSIIRLAIEEPFLPGFGVETPQEEEPEKEKEKPEGLSGLKFFQPQIGEKVKEPKRAPPPAIKTMTKEEIEAEIKKLEGPVVNDTFGDKKGEYTIYFEFKIRSGPEAGRVKRFRARFQYTPEYRKIPFEVLLQNKIEQRFREKIVNAGATPGTYVRMTVHEPQTTEKRIYSFFLNDEGNFEWLSTVKEEQTEKERLLRLPENKDFYNLWENGSISLDELAIIGGKLVEKTSEKKTHYYRWLKDKLKTIEQSEKTEIARKKIKEDAETKRKKIEELRAKELSGLTPEEIQKVIKEEKEEAELEFEPRVKEYKEPEEKEKELVKVKCPHCKRDNWVEKGKEEIGVCKACEFPTGDLTFVVRRKVPKVETEEKLITIPVEERKPGQPPYRTEIIEKKSYYYKYGMVSFQRDAQGSLASAKCWDIPTRPNKLSSTEYTYKSRTFPQIWEKVLEPFKSIITELKKFDKGSEFSAENRKRKNELRVELKRLKETKEERYAELVEQEHPGEAPFKTTSARVPMVGPPRKPCDSCPGAVKPPFSEANCPEIRNAYKYLIGEELPFIVNVWPAAPLMDVEKVIERKYSRFNRIYEIYKSGK